MHSPNTLDRMAGQADGQAGLSADGACEPGAWSPQVEARWIWALLLAGVAARGVRYLLKFPLWEDECFLSVNLLDRGYLDLAAPLEYHQVAPLLFLWVQLSLVRLLGFSEYVLRLFPFVCSLASLLLFAHIARRTVRGAALLLSVAIFSAAYPGIRYAAEAKPYGCDLLVSLVLLAMLIEWERTGRRGWLWALAAVAPLAVGLSYPAVFVAGGISIAVAYLLWTAGPRGDWLAWLVYNVSLAVGFSGWFLLATSKQAAAELGFMADYWQQGFPPLSAPHRIPGWLLSVHTSDWLAYPVGGQHGASALTFVCCVTALVLLVRARRTALVLACLAPLALNMAAAALGRYPYGGHVKLAHYAAPIICLLAGLGAAHWLSRLASGRRVARRSASAMHNAERWATLRRRTWAGRGNTRDAKSRWPMAKSEGLGALRAALVVLSSIAVVSMARDFVHPYKTVSDMWARDFARWFWFHMAFEGEVACLKRDLGQQFSPHTFQELSWSAMYLCNQGIYSPRDARTEPPRLERVSARRPLRCVQYRVPDHPYDTAAFERWLRSMSIDYRLASRERYPFPRYGKRRGKPVTVDYVEVYKFVPKSVPSTALLKRPLEEGKPKTASLRVP